MTIKLFICKRESIKLYLWGLCRPRSKRMRRRSGTAESSRPSKLAFAPSSNVLQFPRARSPRRCTESPGTLPIVPQVHGAFFDFAKDFKAALQLRPGAVRPQPPHIHHPSLLLLVRRQNRGRRLKGGACFHFPSSSSPGPNELVLITPVDTAADFGPLILNLSAVCLPGALCDRFGLLI